MIRSVVLTLSIITNRMWAVVWVITLVPQLQTTFGGNEALMVQSIAGLSGWLGWVLPLLVAEWWLDTRRAPESPVANRVAAGAGGRGQSSLTKVGLSCRHGDDAQPRRGHDPRHVVDPRACGRRRPAAGADAGDRQPRDAAAVPHRAAARRGRLRPGLPRARGSAARRTCPRSVCIKVSARIDGWLREAYFGQLLDGHPRAIRVFDAFPLMRADGQVLYCLALEYARHGDLQRVPAAQPARAGRRRRRAARSPASSRCSASCTAASCCTATSRR